MQLRKVANRELYVRKNLGGSLPSGVGHLLVSVAFNNPKLIKLQAEALRRFVVDVYTLVVVDNSTDSRHSEELKLMAVGEGFTYLKAPKNPYSWIDPSLSHSLALDWAWKQIVEKVQPATVTLLDHDVFPTQEVALSGILEGAVAAGFKRVSLGSSRWLLWPGLLMFDYQAVARYRMSFMPRRDTDSGGALFWNLYSTLPESSFRFLKRKELIFSSDSPRYGDGGSGEFHIFDDIWLHLVDGSGWSDGVEKMKKLPGGKGNETLDSLLLLVSGLRHPDS